MVRSHLSGVLSIAGMPPKRRAPWPSPAVAGEAASSSQPAVAGNTAVRAWVGTAEIEAAASAEDDNRQRQFAVAVPLRWSGPEWLDFLPWQSLAVAYLIQAPGSHSVRGLDGADYNVLRLQLLGLPW